MEMECFNTPNAVASGQVTTLEQSDMILRCLVLDALDEIYMMGPEGTVISQPGIGIRGAILYTWIACDSKIIQALMSDVPKSSRLAPDLQEKKEKEVDRLTHYDSPL